MKKVIAPMNVTCVSYFKLHHRRHPADKVEKLSATADTLPTKWRSFRQLPTPCRQSGEAFGNCRHLADEVEKLSATADTLPMVSPGAKEEKIAPRWLYTLRKTAWPALRAYCRQYRLKEHLSEGEDRGRYPAGCPAASADRHGFTVYSMPTGSPAWQNHREISGSPCFHKHPQFVRLAHRFVNFLDRICQCAVCGFNHLSNFS